MRGVIALSCRSNHLRYKVSGGDRVAIKSRKGVAGIKKLLVLLASLLSLGTNNICAADSEAWHFSLTPYIWAVNVHGDIVVGLPYDVIPTELLHVSEKFSSILKHVHSGAMLDVSANKGNFGLFASAMYANIRDLKVKSFSGFDAYVNSKFGLYTVGASYRIYEYKVKNYSELGLDPYFGVRFTRNKSGGLLIEMPEENLNRTARLTEPIVGLKLLCGINEHWSLSVAGDLGKFKQRQDSYNIIGLVGYKPITDLSLYLGYRQFYQYFTQGSGPSYYYWKMHIGGPIAGVSFNF